MSTLAQATAPTARAVAWTPVAVVVAGLLAAAALVRTADQPPGAVLTLGTAALAAALVFALRDPAADLLAAVPTSAFARSLLRAGLVAAVAVPGWLVVTWLLPGSELALLPLLALAATGLAVATATPLRVGTAAALPLVWATLAQFLGDVHGLVGDAATVWREHPAYVTLAALALLALGGRR
jgi:hypothetical protein